MFAAHIESPSILDERRLNSSRTMLCGCAAANHEKECDGCHAGAERKGALQSDRRIEAAVSGRAQWREDMAQQGRQRGVRTGNSAQPGPTGREASDTVRRNPDSDNDGAAGSNDPARSSICMSRCLSVSFLPCGRLARSGPVLGCAGRGHWGRAAKGTAAGSPGAGTAEPRIASLPPAHALRHAHVRRATEASGGQKAGELKAARVWKDSAARAALGTGGTGGEGGRRGQCACRLIPLLARALSLSSCACGAVWIAAHLRDGWLMRAVSFRLLRHGDRHTHRGSGGASTKKFLR
jgi:CDGSH-type Zn-finger protein